MRASASAFLSADFSVAAFFAETLATASTSATFASSAFVSFLATASLVASFLARASISLAAVRSLRARSSAFLIAVCSTFAFSEEASAAASAFATFVSAVLLSGQQPLHGPLLPPLPARQLLALQRH